MSGRVVCLGYEPEPRAPGMSVGADLASIRRRSLLSVLTPAPLKNPLRDTGLRRIGSTLESGRNNARRPPRG